MWRRLSGQAGDRGTQVSRHLLAGVLGAALIAIGCLATGPAFAQGAEGASDAPVLATCAERVGDGPVIWREDALAAAREAVRQGDGALKPAYDRLLQDADEALERAPVSVTEKTRVPPSGDKRDYMSLAPYWWPDPKQSDGLPYIRRDGEVNPERAGDGFDRVRTQTMMDDVETLALAAYFSGNAVYGHAAAERLRVFFLDRASAMNPHLRFAQSVPGRNDGRAIGIIDTAGLVAVTDSARLLRQGGFMPEADYAGLQSWFADYSRWLITDPMGQEERAAKNNHGTFYDMQLAAFTLFAGDCALSRRVLDDTRVRIDAQIDRKGQMPLERTRTRSFHYHLFNLDAFLTLARIGEVFGEDLYSFEGRDGAGLIDALDFVTGYAGRTKSWPFREIAPANIDRDLWRLSRTANAAVSSESLDRAARLSTGRQNDDRVLLLTYEPPS